jgi:hypothetical protein
LHFSRYVSGGEYTNCPIETIERAYHSDERRRCYMKRKTIWFYVKVILSVYAAWFLGAMFDFSFFPADDPVVREIAYCTMIICVNIAVCANKICKHSNRKDGSNDEEER